MTIVTAVDTGPHAVVVAREAASLAAAFDEDLALVHVLSRDDFVSLERTSMRESGSPIPPAEIRAIATEIANEAGEALDSSYDAVGLVGDAAERIIEHANTHDARYVVVGGHRRSPVGKAIFSSVTQDVILNAHCPVLTVMEAHE